MPRPVGTPLAGAKDEEAIIQVSGIGAVTTTQAAKPQ